MDNYPFIPCTAFSKPTVLVSSIRKDPIGEFHSMNSNDYGQVVKGKGLREELHTGILWFSHLGLCRLGFSWLWHIFAAMKELTVTDWELNK
uniref:Uncharacterized protein n=1 Tax=Candidatus Kentrum sp. FM TaxID=2126340 RepID=A0A450S598_9GAMM|nr:MAG: hypothetical protein BECKFM1743A_GA0114220_100434 [Candidatus Kentron sp. FM]VFJ65843.1 MAG: hypothetical protein BECKFM1743C_GA0114222_104054 [Candidatus Kentron sp. FM]VFK07079.1 MAG: hypothetical protein BECKFM1743B_GA0114221_100314 [Candidatus Kentron sp. FM]